MKRKRGHRPVIYRIRAMLRREQKRRRDKRKSCGKTQSESGRICASPADLRRANVGHRARPAHRARRSCRDGRQQSAHDTVARAAPTNRRNSCVPRVSVSDKYVEASSAPSMEQSAVAPAVPQRPADATAPLAETGNSQWQARVATRTRLPTKSCSTGCALSFPETSASGFARRPRGRGGSVSARTLGPKARMPEMKSPRCVPKFP